MIEGKCKKEDCVYRSVNHGLFITCDYMYWTGVSRGCPIDDNCKRYTPGERQRNWMSSFSFIPKSKEEE